MSKRNAVLAPIKLRVNLGRWTGLARKKGKQDCKLRRAMRKDYMPREGVADGFLVREQRKTLWGGLLLEWRCEVGMGVNRAEGKKTRRGDPLISESGLEAAHDSGSREEEQVPRTRKRLPSRATTRAQLRRHGRSLDGKRKSERVPQHCLHPYFPLLPLTLLKRQPPPFLDRPLILPPRNLSPSPANPGCSEHKEEHPFY